jgi:hypothetical protein
MGTHSSGSNVGCGALPVTDNQTSQGKQTMRSILKQRLTELEEARDPNNPQLLWIRSARLGSGILLIASAATLLYARSIGEAKRTVDLALCVGFFVIGITVIVGEMISVTTNMSGAFDVRNRLPPKELAWCLPRGRMLTRAEFLVCRAAIIITSIFLIVAVLSLAATLLFPAKVECSWFNFFGAPPACFMHARPNLHNTFY